MLERSGKTWISGWTMREKHKHCLFFVTHKKLAAVVTASRSARYVCDLSPCSNNYFAVMIIVLLYYLFYIFGPANSIGTFLLTGGGGDFLLTGV